MIPAVAIAYFGLRRHHLLIRDRMAHGASIQHLMDVGQFRAREEVSQDADLSYALYWFEAYRLASRLPLWSKTSVPACLPRSTALIERLAQRKIESDLRLGVCKPDASAPNPLAIASHAWVEVNGVMVGEPSSVAQRFTPVPIESWLACSRSGENSELKQDDGR